MGKKLFVIAEVEPTGNKHRDRREYKPVVGGDYESMWLKPERVIDEERLWYDKPKEREIYFTRHGWVKAYSVLSHRFLILRPPKPKQTEIERIVAQCPVCTPGIKEWLKGLVEYLDRKNIKEDEKF